MVTTSLPSELSCETITVKLVTTAYGIQQYIIDTHYIAKYSMPEVATIIGEVDSTYILPPTGSTYLGVPRPEVRTGTNSADVSFTATLVSADLNGKLRMTE